MNLVEPLNNKLSAFYIAYPQKLENGLVFYVRQKVFNDEASDKLYLAKEGEGYRAFVLLKMPVDEARKIVTGAVRNSREDRFNDLENEIKKVN